MDKNTMSAIIMRMFLLEKYKNAIEKQTDKTVMEIMDYLQPEHAKNLMNLKSMTFFDKEEKMKLIDVVLRDPEVIRNFNIRILPAYLFGYMVNEVYDKCNEVFVEFLLYNIDCIGEYKFAKLKKEIKPILESVILMNKIT